MTLSSVCQSVEMMSFSQVIDESPFWNPVIESTHLVALALLVGSITAFDARLLGLAMRQVPVSQLGRRLLPWTWTGFGMSLTTGSLLFISSAEGYCFNPAFRIKLLLILLAGVNMAVFHLTVYRSVSGWGEGSSTPLRAKLAGSFSVLLWLAVVMAGRWIAFTEGG